MNPTDAVTPRVHRDRQTRLLYANDASMYEELPRGVAFPHDAAEIQALVRRAADEDFSLTARSAGTSLAGQATGEGVIMDVSRHMTGLLELDPDQRTARVQPGVIRDSLNRAAAQHGLLFGPDTATTSRCMLGGMIGNNSCGIHSVKYGTTRDHILEIEAVLSDGSRAVFGPLTPAELEAKKQLDSLEGYIYRGMTELVRRNREAILEAYPHPDILRRNTGYALDRLCRMAPFEPGGPPFNLAELLCGSEGTLAITASATVRLVPQDPHRCMVVPHFDSIEAAMEATVEIVRHGPSAVELVDDIILEATRGNLEQQKNRFFLEGEPRAILITQFDGDDPARLRERAEEVVALLREKGLCEAAPVLDDSGDIRRVWELRKAGLGLLMGLGSEERSPSFCEDTAVRVEDLPDYVADFRRLLDKYGTDCVFYAHASVGELHLRPVIDIENPEGVEKMRAMAEEVASLVRSYRGSLSGEHGDGRVRAPYIEKVLGTEMMPLLRQVKELWDPNYRFNPGKIIEPKPLGVDLRRPTRPRAMEADTVFAWRREGGFDRALELCNGAGVCRKLAGSGGTMCPSYMATREEKDSTRGRANLFRQLFAGEGPEAFRSEELHDALSLCLSCKACKSECPANVDMARMKAEFTHGWHREHGITRTERFFGQAGRLYPLAARFPRLSNALLASPAGKEMLYRLLGIDRRRTLPRFARQTFTDWWEERREGGTDVEKRPAVYLLNDLFTNYHEPQIARSAVRVLEALGYRVICDGVTETGRPQISKGLMDRARELSLENIPRLHALAAQGIPVVGLEPSELLTLRDEYLDLSPDDMLEQARKLADRSFLLEEFLLSGDHPLQPAWRTDREKAAVLLHGHCHTKALTGNGPVLEALSQAGYRPEAADTGCCGMAGSFGYEADKYELSMQIGGQRLFPAIRQSSVQEREETIICAPGFSCRHQIRDGTGERALHPAELLEAALPS
ncbi:MAG: FAD-linked oxidase C-terminal domain-containing protein [Balneolaceae bacterium]|nr:FAD-linked oxidase C-terminal domain-containing protein [Balneolaceae bacterium]